MLDKQKHRQKRKMSIRKRISGTVDKPRASVFRSNRYLTCQLIDDVSRVTILGASDKAYKGTRTENAQKLGEEIAKLATKKKITQVVFDRSGYRYHGRIAALAEGMRSGGLEF